MSKLPGAKKKATKNKIKHASEATVRAREDAIVKRLVDKHGQSPEKAQAIAGALLRETTNLDPTQRQVTRKRKDRLGPGLGVVQHELGFAKKKDSKGKSVDDKTKPKRGNLLKEFAKKQGINHLTMEAQVDFLMEETKGNVRGSLGKEKFRKALEGNDEFEIAANFTKWAIAPATSLFKHKMVNGRAVFDKKKDSKGKLRKVRENRDTRKEFTHEEQLRGVDASNIAIRTTRKEDIKAKGSMFGSAASTKFLEEFRKSKEEDSIMNPGTRSDDTYTPPAAIMDRTGGDDKDSILDLDSIENDESNSLF